MRKTICTLCLHVLIQSCAGIEREKQFSTLPDSPPTPANSSPDSFPKPEIPPIDSIFKRRYCEDSIYSDYLLQKQVKAKAEEVRGLKDRSRRHKMKNIKFMARVHTFKLLKGLKSNHLREIPVVNDPRLLIWIRYFHSPRGNKNFLKWLVRGAQYEPKLLNILREYGLPKELFYLAMIESGFSNHAYSRARATGTWQFIGATAKSYGLTINQWVDERRDLEKSTMAAARYLKKLHQKFDNWYLTIAAYNAGPGKIRRAIRRAHSRDYWRLSRTKYLKRETKHYVPKLLAAHEIANNLPEYGFTIYPDIDQFDPVVKVSAKPGTSLYKIAQDLGVSYRTIKDWNPELRSSLIPLKTSPKNTTYFLNISSKYEVKYYKSYEQTRRQRVQNVTFHTIRGGDTLIKLARQFGTDLDQIREMNPYLNETSLQVGRKIAIPILSTPQKKDKG